VVKIHRDIAIVAIADFAFLVTEHIPNTGTAAAFAHGALYLIGGSGYAKTKIRAEIGAQGLGRGQRAATQQNKYQSHKKTGKMRYFICFKAFSMRLSGITHMMATTTNKAQDTRG
jgi:hypothetical protein